MLLLQYAKVDGLITGVWQSPVVTVLEAQMVPEDPLYGYLMTDTTDGALDVQERYRVDAEHLVAKTPVTMTATPPSFAADGVATSTITVSPFASCTLRLQVPGAPTQDMVLTAQDPTLVLTSDVPQTFLVRLVSQALVWAEPLQVEAV